MIMSINLPNKQARYVFTTIKPWLFFSICVALVLITSTFLTYLFFQWPCVLIYTKSNIFSLKVYTLSLHNIYFKIIQTFLSWHASAFWSRYREKPTLFSENWHIKLFKLIYQPITPLSPSNSQMHHKWSPFFFGPLENSITFLHWHGLWWDDGPIWSEERR